MSAGFVAQKFGTHNISAVYLFAMCIGLLLMGPIQILPNQLWITLVGITVNAASIGLMFPPQLFEIIGGAEEKSGRSDS